MLTLDMRLATIIALGLLPLLNLAQAPPAFNADPPKVCDACDEWTEPRVPYKMFGNTYYVGTAGLSSVLVTSPAGHILLDGGLAQSASLIDRSIKTAGGRNPMLMAGASLAPTPVRRQRCGRRECAESRGSAACRQAQGLVMS